MPVITEKISPKWNNQKRSRRLAGIYVRPEETVTVTRLIKECSTYAINVTFSTKNLIMSQTKQQKICTKGTYIITTAK